MDVEIEGFNSLYLRMDDTYCTVVLQSYQTSSTVQYYSTVHDSTVQYCTVVLYCTVQYCPVQQVPQNLQFTYQKITSNLKLPNSFAKIVLCHQNKIGYYLSRGNRTSASIWDPFMKRNSQFTYVAIHKISEKSELFIFSNAAFSFSSDYF